MDVESSNVTTESSDTERFGSTFLICGLGVLLLQFLFLMATAVFKLHKIKDVAGGISFIFVALISLFVDFNNVTKINEVKLSTHKRKILGTSLVCMWAVRLAGYLLARHIRMGKSIQTGGDITWCRHLAYWSFQAVWVVVVSLPVIGLNSSTVEAKDLWTPTDITGTTIFGAGLFFELISDQQKFNWKFYKMGNKGLWVTHRLWEWSRHPNYFFEILVWWGVFVLNSTLFRGVAWISVLSPLFVIFIILCVSGLPVMEATADQKYGKYEDYREYKKNTSILIPIHPWLYRRLPVIVKRTLLLDFPLYNYLSTDTDNPDAITVTT